MRGNFILGLVVAFLISMALAAPLQFFKVNWGSIESGNLADWFQAVTAILAIIAALFFPMLHDSRKEAKQNEQKMIAFHFEIEGVIMQYDGLIHDIQMAPQAIFDRIEFYFENKLPEISPLGKEVYIIGTDTRRSVREINKLIDQNNRAYSPGSVSMLLGSAHQYRNYVEKRKQDLENYMRKHHTAPPSA